MLRYEEKSLDLCPSFRPRCSKRVVLAKRLRALARQKNQVLVNHYAGGKSEQATQESLALFERAFAKLCHRRGEPPSKSPACTNPLMQQLYNSSGRRELQLGVNRASPSSPPPPGASAAGSFARPRGVPLAAPSRSPWSRAQGRGGADPMVVPAFMLVGLCVAAAAIAAVALRECWRRNQIRLLATHQRGDGVEVPASAWRSR